MSLISEKKDFKIIADLIPKGSSVIDVGCSDGSLLQYLKDNIEDKAHNAIQRQERTLENITKRKELSTSVSVFNARMYNNFQLPLLLKYFSENYFKNTALKNYMKDNRTKRYN